MRARVLILVVSLDDMRTPFEEYPHSMLILDRIRESAVDAKATIAERFNHDSLARYPTDPPSPLRGFRLRALRFGGQVGETRPLVANEAEPPTRSPPRERRRRCERVVLRLRCRETVYRCRR